MLQPKVLTAFYQIKLLHQTAHFIHITRLLGTMKSTRLFTLLYHNTKIPQKLENPSEILQLVHMRRNSCLFTKQVPATRAQQIYFYWSEQKYANWKKEARQIGRQLPATQLGVAKAHHPHHLPLPLSPPASIAIITYSADFLIEVITVNNSAHVVSFWNSKRGTFRQIIASNAGKRKSFTLNDKMCVKLKICFKFWGLQKRLHSLCVSLNICVMQALLVC